MLLTRFCRRPKVLIAGVVSLGLVGILGFAVSRELTGISEPVTARPPLRPPRPPVSRAEEEYMRALWPIHGDVERSVMRMSLGQIFYKTRDLGRPELRARVEQALATYRGAEARLLALEPPASLLGEHKEYLSAVRLFQEAAVEVLKIFADGRDDHMLAAYPKSQAGSNMIREIGGKFWPHEFPPN
jgi:hypothetical protein